MSSRRLARQRGTRSLGIIVLILGLVHTPLPQPDFHNIRHHDGPGEVCEFHDHLLRWHPGAGQADDVAMLHWHWLFASAEPSDPSPEHAGSAIHAHVVDWQSATWEDGPQVSADTTTRGHVPLSASPSLSSLIFSDATQLVAPAPGARPWRTFGATFAPRTPLSCLLQRWVC